MVSSVAEGKVVLADVSLGDMVGVLPINADIINLAASPVDLEELCRALNRVNYDRGLAEFLIQGFSSGFSLHYEGPREATVARNLKSVAHHPDIVRTVAGPFPARPLPGLRVSPIGLVPKKSPGEYRMIHHYHIQLAGL